MISTQLFKKIKPLIFLALILPSLIWSYKFINGSLGVNPIEKLMDNMGETALRLIVLTLFISSLSDFKKFRFLIEVRRMIGLFAFFYVPCWCFQFAYFRFVLLCFAALFRFACSALVFLCFVVLLCFVLLSHWLVLLCRALFCFDLICCCFAVLFFFWYLFWLVLFVSLPFCSFVLCSFTFFYAFFSYCF